MKNDHPDFEQFLHYLNEQESANPKLVIDEFFNFSSLQESKLLLWEWLRILTGADFDELETCDQDQLLRFFVNLEKLVEASYMVNSENSSC